MLINGNARIATDVIRRELAITPGRPISDDAMVESQRRLAELGLFRRVRITLRNGRQADLAYRQGYYADKSFARFTAADKERQLEEALLLDDPITQIPMAMLI